jgi:hypothetical protein
MDMLAALLVALDLRGGTTALFKGVGRHGEAVDVRLNRRQLALLTVSLGEMENGAFIAGKGISFNADGAAGVADDVLQKRCRSRRAPPAPVPWPRQGPE